MAKKKKKEPTKPMSQIDIARYGLFLQKVHETYDARKVKEAKLIQSAKGDENAP